MLEQKITSSYSVYITFNIYNFKAWSFRHTRNTRNKALAKPGRVLILPLLKSENGLLILNWLTGFVCIFLEVGILSDEFDSSSFTSDSDDSRVDLSPGKKCLNLQS